MASSTHKYPVTGSASFITSVADTTSIDITVVGGQLTIDVKPGGIDHNSLNNTHNLTTDIDHSSITNTHNLTTDIDHNSITNTHDLTNDIDHNSIANTHNLTTDIDHDSITNTHNLTTSIDHDSITNTHNLSTDIDHDGLTNTHDLTTDIDHNSIANTHDLTTDIDHNSITNAHNLTTDIDHDSLTNYSADEHFTQAAISIPASQISDFDTEVSNNSTVSGKQDNVITTRGDLVIGNSSNVAARLAIGTANKVLGSDGTDVSWVDAAGGSEIIVNQSSHSFTVLKPIYHNGSSWALAKADSETTVATHIVKQVIDTDNFKAIQFGKITSTSHGLNVGDYHWVSNATAGNTVTTEPSTGYSNPAFYVLDANNVVAMVYRPSAIGNLNFYTPEIVLIKDVKSNGTNGGTFTSGAWQTRTLNTTENTQTWCSLASNQFTLSAGTYRIKASAPAYDCGMHTCKLANISDTTDAIIGCGMRNDTTGNGYTQTTLMGVITIVSSKIFELQHYCETTKADTGFGVPCNFGVSEVYAQVEIEKIGD